MTEAAQRIHPCPSEASRFEADIPAVCVQNHAANLMPLPNGDIGCVWFGGTQEGIPDISIYFSRLASGQLVLLTLYAKSATDNLTGPQLKEIRRVLES